MMNPKLRAAAIVVVIILVVLALAYFALKLFSYQSVIDALPDEGSTVTFVEAGMPERYVFAGNILTRDIDEPLTNGVIVQERVPSPVSGSDEIVLASIPGSPGLFAGILSADGVLDLLVSGDTNKSDLSVSAEGIAVFSASPAFLVEEETALPSDEENDDGVNETYEAAAPAEVAEVPTPGSIFPQLIAVDVATRAIMPLGLGYSPRILSDGMVLAIAPEGVVKINPRTNARELVVAYPVTELGGSISPSGMTAALPGPNATLEFYSLTGTPTYLGFLERETGSTQAAFLEDKYVFVRTGAAVARYYTVPTEKLPIAAPVAILAITQ